jgi:hypothetical protein
MIEDFIRKIEVKFSRHVGGASANILAAYLQVAVDGKKGVESTTLRLHDQGIEVILEGFDEMSRRIRGGGSDR